MNLSKPGKIANTKLDNERKETENKTARMRASPEGSDCLLRFMVQ